MHRSNSITLLIRRRVPISAVSIDKKELELAREVINKIDDYFEYAFVSKDDQEVVQKILTDYTAELVKLHLDL